MSDFLPDSDPEFNIFASAFSVELGSSGAAFGFTPVEVTGLQSDITGWQGQLTDVASKKADYQAAVQAKETGRVALELKIRAAAKRIKDSSAYTPAVGEDYDIVAETPVFVPATFKTRLKASIVAGKVVITWTKGGAQSVRFYGRLSGQSAWVYIDRDEKSPFTDPRPLANPGVPEHREYMARGVLNDVEIGVDSDIVSVVYSG